MKILVSGSVNVETTLAIEGFPLDYYPVTYARDAVHSSVSGVGVNLALALRRLRNDVAILGMRGRDWQGDLALSVLEAAGVDASGLLPLLDATPLSVVLYDPAGRRQIHVDQKDLKGRSYPCEAFEGAMRGAKAALLTNIEFNRPLLARAQAAGIPIVTDVHTLSDPLDAYNADFMAAADILFLSDERLWAPPQDCARELLGRYRMRAAILGRGADGALLAERDRAPLFLPAASTRPVVNTVGAGDALLSSFTHHWLRGMAMEDALRRAIVFASWKIGEKCAAAGFLDEASLEALCRERGL